MKLDCKTCIFFLISKIGTRKTPVLESLFHKVVGPRRRSFIKKRLQYRRFPVTLAKAFKNIYFEEYLQTTASKNQHFTEKTISRFLSQNYDFHNYYYSL